MLTGYVSRKIFKDDKLPKYLLYKKSRQSKLFKLIKTGSKKCAIVEDMLSGIVVSRHIDCLVNLGVNLPDNVLPLLTSYDKIYIFLDNDSDIVKQKQLDAKHKVLQVCDSVEIIEASLDPKEHTSQQLKEVFELC